MDLDGAQQESSQAAISVIRGCGEVYINTVIYFPPVIISCGTLLKYVLVCLELIVMIFSGWLTQNRNKSFHVLSSHFPGCCREQLCVCVYMTFCIGMDLYAVVETGGAKGEELLDERDGCQHPHHMSCAIDTHHVVYSCRYLDHRCNR